MLQVVGRLITEAFWRLRERSSLFTHTCVFSLSLPATSLAPNFALSPKFWYSPSQRAEVNKSTIKAFFEQNRSIILWVSRFQILISVLNSASSPLERGRDGEKQKHTILVTRTPSTSFLCADWLASDPAGQRGIFSVTCGTFRLSPGQRWGQAEVRFLPLEEVQSPEE